MASTTLKPKPDGPNAIVAMAMTRHAPANATHVRKKRTGHVSLCFDDRCDEEFNITMTPSIDCQRPVAERVRWLLRLQSQWKIVRLASDDVGLEGRGFGVGIFGREQVLRRRKGVFGRRCVK